MYYSKKKPGIKVNKNFFSQRVADRWNKMPASRKQTNSAKEFRNGYFGTTENIGRRTSGVLENGQRNR